MGDHLRVNGGIAIPRRELVWRFSRSGGPGGQSVNTADSRVEVRYDLATSTAIPAHLKARAMDRLAGRLVHGELVVVAADPRSQLHNRRAAEARLVALLAQALAPPTRPRRSTRPSRAAVEARLAAKRRRGDLKRQRHATED